MPQIQIITHIPYYPGDTLYYADLLDDNYWTIRETTIQQIDIILLPNRTLKTKVVTPIGEPGINTASSKEEILKDPPYPIEKYIDSLAMKIFQ